LELLREKIRHAEHLYYVLEIRSQRRGFDKLMRQLKDVESEHRDRW